MWVVLLGPSRFRGIVGIHPVQAVKSARSSLTHNSSRWRIARHRGALVRRAPGKRWRDAGPWIRAGGHKPPSGVRETPRIRKRSPLLERPGRLSRRAPSCGERRGGSFVQRTFSCPGQERLHSRQTGRSCSVYKGASQAELWASAAERRGPALCSRSTRRSQRCRNHPTSTKPPKSLSGL